MDADLDTLCIVVYCTADDLLPEPPGNARRMVTDAEVVTLCVAQAIMGIPSDRRFLKVARKRLATCSRRFRRSPRTSSAAAVWPTARVADGHVREPEPRLQRRSAADRLDPGRVRQKPRDGQALRARRRRRLRLVRVPLPLLLGLPAARAVRARRHPQSAHPRLAQTRRPRGRARPCSSAATATAAKRVLGDKNYAGRDFARAVSDLDATIVRPRRKDEPGHGPHLAPIRQRIESIFWTCKDLLTLERHGARTLQGTQRTHPPTLPHPRRLRHPQPPTRPPKQSTRRLCRLNPWNHSSRGWVCPPGQGAAPR